LVLAPDVPPEFWNDQALQEALTVRHMGRVVRAYRCHPYHGRHALSQQTVAAWVGLTQAQLSRIENGSAIVHLDRLVQWAHVLGIPGEYLWFRLPDDNSEARETQDVKRRAFLGAAGAGLVGALTPQAARTPDPSPVGPPLAAIITNLAAAMLAPKTTDSSTTPLSVDELTKQVTSAWHLRQRANYEALGRLLPHLIAQAQTSAAGLTDADHGRAGRVVVHTYNAASSLLKTLGDGALALVAADRAVRAAQALDDPVLSAAAMYRLANVLLTARRLDDSGAVALRAASLIEPGKMQTPRSLAMWGGLLLTAAVAAARNTDESAAWELMGEARAASRLLGTDHADIYSIFGPTNVAIHGVQVAVELRNGRDAVRRSYHVDPDRLPGSLVERRGQFLIDVAHGHVLQSDDATAVTTLLRADQIAPQEVRLSRDVHSMTRTLLGRERTGAAPGLRELATRLGVTD
jgi:transcriptional regulator with XRE-family HTH domain